MWGEGGAVKRGDPGRRDGPRLQIRQSNVCRGGGEGGRRGKGDIDDITADIGPGEIFKHFV